MPMMVLVMNSIDISQSIADQFRMLGQLSRFQTDL